MSSLWQWFTIALIVAGASASIIVGVIFLYLFAETQYLKEFCSTRLGLS